MYISQFIRSIMYIKYCTAYHFNKRRLFFHIDCREGYSTYVVSALAVVLVGEWFEAGFEEETGLQVFGGVVDVGISVDGLHY